jgi:O-succinylbenzoic acid--CoA ligase
VARSSGLSVRAAAAEAADRLALVADGRRWTWAEVAIAVRAEGERLVAAGVLAADASSRRVAFDAYPSAESVIRLLALVEAEACVVPLDPRLPPSARAARVRSLAPLFDLDAGNPIAPNASGDSDQSGRLRWSPRPGAAEADADATPLAILFTSGTTGAPRAVELSRAAFRASASSSAAHLGGDPEDRWLCCLPLAHVGGLSVITRCLLGRRAVVLADGFDAATVADLLERETVTLASFVPTMLHRLFAIDPGWRAPSSLRAVLLGGAPAGEDVWEEIARREFPALATYGMTETCSQVATGRHGSPRRLIPLDGVRFGIKAGRIAVAGPMLCTRIGVENATGEQCWTRDGFLRTGDLGRLADGALEVTGRADAMIITGGQNVSPAAVEAVLSTHPAIRQAAVFGLPDDQWGELVAAVLEESDVAPPDPDELRAWLAARLTPYERPRRVAWVRDLPRTPSGKLDRAAARERCHRVMETV